MFSLKLMHRAFYSWLLSSRKMILGPAPAFASNEVLLKPAFQDAPQAQRSLLPFTLSFKGFDIG
jgi:hypothetical protein